MAASVKVLGQRLEQSTLYAQLSKSRPRPSRQLLSQISVRTVSQFKVVEHTISCAHTREYAAATAFGDDDRPRLVVKQYIPLGNLNPLVGDVTIIGAHANGFPKVRPVSSYHI